MRIVVKIATSPLTHGTGHELFLIFSGAIGMGVGKPGLRQRLQARAVKWSSPPGRSMPGGPWV